jgi:hypothetical protein
MTVEIKNLAEKIVFDENQLFKLKEALSQLNAKKIELKEVKQVILNQRTEILESLVDLFSFYLNQQGSRLSSSEYREEIEKLQAQIEERENLLEEIGKRLEKIVNKNFAIDKEQIKGFIFK